MGWNNAILLGLLTCVKPAEVPLNVTVFPSKTPEKASTFSDWQSFSKKLETKGFKRLGSGAYSIVYAKPDSDRVIKVTRSDDGWIDYCKWAAENGFAGGLAPKVYSYKRHKNFSVSVMERMERTGHYITGAMDASPIKYLIKMQMQYNNDLTRLLLDSVAPKYVEFADKMRQRFEHFDLHDGNVMVRKDGSLCFTDPIANSRFASIKRRLKEKDFELRLAA